ncbi:uncharacterized protein LOC141881776 isoform X3 [Acropora palmata]|uniref:uncharacterized protein LOC141881776 isoform X3 n=1 Tax=Acropora palmata TaxID=6131 RepID=UPI003DA195D2
MMIITRFLLSRVRHDEVSKFSVCVVIFYFLALCEASETCRKRTVCSCTFNNGSEVNLKPIDGGNTPRRSKIILQCDEKAGKGTIKQFIESKEGGSSTYTATLRSKYACATGGEPLALD